MAAFALSHDAEDSKAVKEDSSASSGSEIIPGYPLAVHRVSTGCAQAVCVIKV